MTTMRVVGECFFWYRLTRVFPDKFHRAVKRLCVCVHGLWPGNGSCTIFTANSSQLETQCNTSLLLTTPMKIWNQNADICLQIYHHLTRLCTTAHTLFKSANRQANTNQNNCQKPHDVPRAREMSSLRWSKRCSVMALRAFNSLPKLVKILAQDSGIRAHVYAKFFVSSLAEGSANNATSCLSLSAQISSSRMHCLPRRPLFTHGWPTYINKQGNHR